MKLISPSKKSYLLDAPLEVLHEENMEWVEEIKFWKDEVAFFYTLIIQKEKKSPLYFESEEAKSIEQHLINISVEKLEELNLEVQLHEHFLSKIMDDVTLDEQLYRSRHTILARKFYDFECEFKEMKKKIFHFIKQI